MLTFWKCQHGTIKRQGTEPQDDCSRGESCVWTDTDLGGTTVATTIVGRITLPRKASDGPYLAFVKGNCVDKRYEIHDDLYVNYGSRTSLGFHASNDGITALCGIKLVSSGVYGPRKDAALHVTCQYCQARLVHGEVLSPFSPNVTDYAADYGQRN